MQKISPTTGITLQLVCNLLTHTEIYTVWYGYLATLYVTGFMETDPNRTLEVMR